MASLLVFVALVAVAALSGARFQPGDWYLALAKPAWTPPGWLFAPVWTLLYLAIAVAGWLVWRAASRRRGAPLALWGAQLVLNGIWSWLFFGLHRPDLALVDIALLWAAIGAFVLAARPVRLAAAGLFVPYWLWVTFAAALNFAIWRLNPAVGA
jgi:tryptophan-rich sensory protein